MVGSFASTVTGTYVSGRPPWTRTRCPPAPAGWGPCRKRGVSAAAEGCVRPSCEGPQATLLLSWTAEPSEMSQFTISSGSHLPVLRATGFSLPAFPLRARAPVPSGPGWLGGARCQPHRGSRVRPRLGAARGVFKGASPARTKGAVSLPLSPILLLPPLR